MLKTNWQDDVPTCTNSLITLSMTLFSSITADSGVLTVWLFSRCIWWFRGIRILSGCSCSLESTSLGIICWHMWEPLSPWWSIGTCCWHMWEPLSLWCSIGTCGNSSIARVKRRPKELPGSCCCSVIFAGAACLSRLEYDRLLMKQVSSSDEEGKAEEGYYCPSIVLLSRVI